MDNQGLSVYQETTSICFDMADDPEESYDHYRRNGGDTTINSILGRPWMHRLMELRMLIGCHRSSRFGRIYSSNAICGETDKYIFVHAGIDLTWMIGMKQQITRKSGLENHSTKQKIILEKSLSWAYTGLWFVKARAWYR